MININMRSVQRHIEENSNSKYTYKSYFNMFVVEYNIQIHQIPKLLIEKDIINELIPNIGDRLNFITKYEEFSSQKKENVSS